MLLEVCVGQDNQNLSSGEIAKVFVYSPSSLKMVGISQACKLITQSKIDERWYRRLFEIEDNTVIKFMSISKEGNSHQAGGTGFFLVNHQFPNLIAKSSNALLKNGYIAGQIHWMSYNYAVARYGIYEEETLHKFYKPEFFNITNYNPIDKESFLANVV